MKRTIIILLISVIAIVSLQARGTDDSMSGEPVKVRMVVPGGATLATIALLDTNSINENYIVNLEIVKSSDLIAARIISGEADFAVIPSNLAAVLANKGTGIRLAGPAIWGLLYIVTSEDLNGWDDLRGQKISMLGRGLTPDITFRYLLRENGIDPDEDLELVYVSSAAELAPTFLSGRSTISMMPEPMITTVLSRKPDTRILVDVQDEWRDRYGSSYPQASLVVSGDFEAKYPAYTDAFIEKYAAAVTAAVTDPEAAGAAVAELASELNADIIARAIPRMNLEFVGAIEARGALENYYAVLESFNPATIGGKMPTDDFYLP